MLRAIKKDLMTLEGTYFGTYKATPFAADSETIQTVDFMIDNFVEVYPFGTRRNYEDFIFSDWKDDEIDEDFDQCMNSYNWNGPVVVQVRFFRYRGHDYTAVAFHRYGDVRGNYTKYAILDCDRAAFVDKMLDLRYDIPAGPAWSVQESFFDECGVVSAYNHETGESFDGYYDKAPDEVRRAVDAVN